jgi:anti-sigma-K factor RskA
VDRELTRVELDELLALYALDALDGEEHAQVTRYVERDVAAREELDSLRQAVSWLPPDDVRAPASLWAGIEGALDVSSRAPEPPRLRFAAAEAATATDPGRATRRGRRVVAVLAAAAIVIALVLGVQVSRQQHRIDDLAAEMHRDPMERQAMTARASPDAHVIPLDAMQGGAGADVVMLPDGTGYLMGRELPELDAGRAYQLWATVGEGPGARTVSLGVLGRAPGISPFRLAATPTMFEVTAEPAGGSDAPGGAVVLRGSVA